MKPAWQLAHKTVIALRQLALSLLMASLQKGLEEESFPQHIKDRSKVVFTWSLACACPSSPSQSGNILEVPSSTTIFVTKVASKAG
jgi:hypothetical protein